MALWYVATLSRYELVEADTADEAQRIGEARMAGRIIRTVRPATDDEIDLARFDERMRREFSQVESTDDSHSPSKDSGDDRHPTDSAALKDHTMTARDLYAMGFVHDMMAIYAKELVTNQAALQGILSDLLFVSNEYGLAFDVALNRARKDHTDTAEAAVIPDAVAENKAE